MEKKFKNDSVFADALGISRQSVANWRAYMDTNGEQGNGITQDNLDKICNVLDITEAELRGLNIQRNITSAPKDVVGNVSRTIPFWDVLAVGGNSILADQSPVGRPTDMIEPGTFLQSATGS